MNVPVLDNTRARRLFLCRHGLLTPQSGPGKGADLAGLIHDLGFVQIDSVNTFARAHDHILWTRRGQYRPRALEHAVGRDRTVFEHWTHDASAVPMDFYPYWRLRFERAAQRLQSRWATDRRAGFMEKTEEVLRRISDHGCCTSADVGEGEEKGSGGWWDWHPSKTALEYLWHSGQLAVARRVGFRKVYDLPERVIPESARQTRLDDAEIVDWHCRAAISRLGFATSGQIADFWATVTKEEARDWCARETAVGNLTPIEIEGADGKLRPAIADPAALDTAVPDPGQRVRILSPFDPALRDRTRAERLFGFRYRIEIFVPEAQRQYGYYVFPVLEGDRLIGRIDMKRKGEVLAVRAFWPEVGVRTGTGRLARLRTELDRAARFAGCNRVDFDEGWVQA